MATVDVAQYRAMSRRAAQTARRVRLALWFEEVKGSWIRRIDRACSWFIVAAWLYLVVQYVRECVGW